MRLLQANEIPANRRAILAGMAMAAMVMSCSKPNGTGKSVKPVLPPPDPKFLKLSRRLTGYDDLDPLTAARLAAGFARFLPAFHIKFDGLGGLGGGDPASLVAAASAAGLGPPALAIVAAWYTGSVGSGAATATVAYHDALMQRAVADVLAPPTYVLGGPAWWVAPTPVVASIPPNPPAAEPAKVGTLEPRQA